MKLAGPIATIIVIVIAALLLQGIYIVEEREQAIVLQFGEHVRTVREPGLKLKVPFVQNVIYFDSRIMLAGGSADEYLTFDKKRLVVDHISRWRIVDPLTFYQTVRTEQGALARLDQIISSGLRQEIARHEFIDVIRAEREGIMHTVSTEAKPLAERFGIELLDVRIRRLDLPDEVQQSVFDRMEAERERIALRYRAEGEEAARNIRAEADKERQIIIAEANQRAEILRGEGDAEAARIYAEAYGRDPDFYGFIRRMNAYERIVPSDTTFVLGTDSELFKYLEGPGSP